MTFVGPIISFRFAIAFYLILFIIRCPFLILFFVNFWLSCLSRLFRWIFVFNRWLSSRDTLTFFYFESSTFTCQNLIMEILSIILLQASIFHFSSVQKSLSSIVSTNYLRKFFFFFWSKFSPNLFWKVFWFWFFLFDGK